MDLGVRFGAGITMERLTIKEQDQDDTFKCNTLKDSVVSLFVVCSFVCTTYKGSRLAGSFVVGLVVS